jgi:hypothetical protein|tara:strand:+ start:797 stop:1435 length:639 start_codon:yes stop_codon:yes gene_type:complete
MNNSDKYVISEFYAFEADSNLIKEAEEKNKPIIMKGILQKANTENRNGRVYPLNILKREAKKYEEAVSERRATGELDHPDSAVVSLSNVSHMVTEMWWEEDTLMGAVQLLETPSGNILKGLLKSGVMLGISSRGVGSVKSRNGLDEVQEDFELIAFDFVSSPSTPGAYLFKESKSWGLTKLDGSSSKILKTNDSKNSFDDLNKLSNKDFWKL